MTETTEAIRKVVQDTVSRGPLANAVTDIVVESAADEDDVEFLRIVVNWRPLDRDVDAELEALLENIEAAVERQDSRYASVRFMDAA